MASDSSEHGHTLTDEGNAQRFVEQHGSQVRFVSGLGWHVWDGNRWFLDEAAIFRLAIETARRVYGEAQRAGDHAPRVGKHAQYSCSERGFAPW